MQMELRRVFPKAIEIVDQLSSMGGWFCGFGVLVLVGTCFITWLFWFGGLAIGSGADIAITGAIVNLLGFLTAYFFIRVDGTGYDVAPVLFNRGKLTVSEFLPKVSLFSFQRSTFTVATHDWACVRGEIMKTLVGGASNAHHEYALMISVTDRPGATRVVRRFRVGMSYLTPDGPASLWEYLRRYMQYEGPPLTEKGMLRGYEERKLPLWRMWFRLQPFLGPDVSWYDFKGDGFMKVFSLVFALLMPFVFPITALFGFGGWLANQLKTPMEWPQQIIVDAGGPALTEEQARAKARDHSQEATI